MSKDNDVHLASMASAWERNQIYLAHYVSSMSEGKRQSIVGSVYAKGTKVMGSEQPLAGHPPDPVKKGLADCKLGKKNPLIF